MGRGRKPKVQPEVMVALYREGLSLRQIGGKVSLHYTTVLAALDKAGITRRPKTRPVRVGPTTEDLRLIKNGTLERRQQLILTRRAEWVDLYRAGYSLMDIGAMYGKHHTVVLIELRKADEKRRPHGGGRKAGGLQPKPSAMTLGAAQHHRVLRMMTLAASIAKRKARMCA